MAVTAIMNALKTVLPATYHYMAPQKKPPKYIVWGETDIRHGLDADNETEILLVSGELWFYTMEEFDTLVSDIIQALTDAGATWNCPSVGREDDTGMIVYGFAWGIACGDGEIY